DFQTATYMPESSLLPYNGSADLWTAEPYGTNFSLITNAVKVFNTLGTKPIWLAQNSIAANLVVPKAYFAIISGATGLHYFSWDSIKNQPDVLAAIEQVFSELKGLNNAIFGSPMDSMVIAPTGIGTMSRFDPTTGTAYVLSVNPVATNVQGNFTVQGLAAGQQITVLNENRTITAGPGYFTDSFTGVSRHVYTIQGAPAGLTATVTGQTGLAGARDWAVQVSNRGIGAANAAQITSLTLSQTGGTACTPIVVPLTFPVTLGNLAPSQSASGNVLINFTGCDSTSTFNAALGLAANGGATMATVVLNNEHM
ncbi:MAG TPA: hypothetical protein VGS58_21975, partial [Candidatus Sulfopaludibacter sp.]|nr:hypothetical protein [Candidatus Sulfopaludibacter sp.]